MNTKLIRTVAARTVLVAFLPVILAASVLDYGIALLQASVTLLLSDIKTLHHEVGLLWRNV